jgi:hypothetical protein
MNFTASNTLSTSGLAGPSLVLQISEPDFPSANSIRKEAVLNTPSDWFAIKYPRLTKQFGPAFLETNWLDKDGRLCIEPVEINIDLMAGILGGEDQNIKTVYYQPEHQWYSLDPVLTYFSPTTEEKLKLELSQHLVHCAAFLSKNRAKVNIGPIFTRFRTEEVLDSILKRAEGMLAVNETFFDHEKTGNRKDPIALAPPQTAHIFVKEGLEPKKGTLLSVAEAYAKYVDFCQVKKMPVALQRKEFREPVIVAIRNTFGLGLRRDLKKEGKYTAGWSHLDAKVLAA